MPYITQDERKAIDKALGELPWMLTDGQLTYAIFLLAKRYRADPLLGKPRPWQDLSEGIKALECAKMEYYRRYIAPHEDEAIQRNGDV